MHPWVSAFGYGPPSCIHGHEPEARALQCIDVETCQLLSEEGLQALCALSAGCPDVQRIDVERRQLVIEEAFRHCVP